MKIKLLAATSLAAALCLPATAMAQALPLFDAVTPKNAVKAEATSSQSVRVNRRALNAPQIEIDLFGETVTAVRDRVERHKGSLVWVGRIGNNIQDRVVITARGNAYSALVNFGNRNFEMVGTRNEGLVFNELDLDAFPALEPAALPEGDTQGETAASGTPVVSGNAIQQDLLVAYTDDACTAAGGTSGSDCSQVEAQIQAAVVQGNQVYIDSEVNIVMNVVGMNEYVYTEGSKTANQMLDEVTFTGDGQLEQVHTDRDTLGADLVALITQSGGGFCGIAWVGSSQSYAFSQTARGCLSNRTLTHELGHNQGSLHARSQYASPPSGNYNYGFRRCNDNGVDDPGSAPYFSTVMAYSCSGAVRIGLMANPNVLYSGIPSGIDPDVDPANAAYSARTLNESAANISGFRDSPPTAVPTAPSGLSASAAGFDAINLNWTDNASNETSFTVERSTGGGWSNIATLGSNATSFGDNGLSDDTTYSYRVSAANAAGSSAVSNTASATTDVIPPTIDDKAIGQIATKGAVSGSYTATYEDDGVVQTITEASSGGRKSRRKQSFTHDWTFDVSGGAGGVVVNANAWVSGSEGANFAFSSDGGVSYTQMFTVSGNDNNGTYSYVLPGSTSGAVRIRATDAAQTNGEGVDTLSVDQIVITSTTDMGDPPANPSNMATGAVTAESVAMKFTDNADDEFGFEIWRATSNPGTNCNAGAEISTVGANTGTGSVNFTDSSAASSTQYWYWAKAFNGAGDNGECSNAASATTLVGAAISASLNGFKVKGKHTVDVSWSGASGAVDITRNGSTVVTGTANDGAYRDDIGAKGGATYTYEVCETGTSTCSDPVSVTF